MAIHEIDVFGTGDDTKYGLKTRRRVELTEQGGGGPGTRGNPLGLQCLIYILLDKYIDISYFECRSSVCPSEHPEEHGRELSPYTLYGTHVHTRRGSCSSLDASGAGSCPGRVLETRH
ncbi:unnamed protein product [Danaus chrysippus]|uniref:(African queen) hypothetical protein n=1 Tax=Danaus chrysippus TaxID=151541 RepID=A0A8J2RFY6_9NEOP|nr:unnamed protein product [Danaus chrysippus]